MNMKSLSLRKKFIYYLIYLEKQNKFNVYIFHKVEIYL